MVVSKHLTHFCYPIRLVLHRHLNSHVAYLASNLKIQTTHEGNISTCHRTLFSDCSDQSLTEVVHQKEDFRPVGLSVNNCVSEPCLLSSDVPQGSDVHSDIHFHSTSCIRSSLG